LEASLFAANLLAIRDQWLGFNFGIAFVGAILAVSGAHAAKAATTNE
jgi:hypothetical protein